jgi:predicted XRE-type DNA-binding protein
MSNHKLDTFDSVWDAIADTQEEAANLRVRADVMRKIAAIVEERSWTQAQAASHCGVTQPRINDLLRGRISRFSLDALVNMAAALGQQVHIEFDALRAKRVKKSRPAATPAFRHPAAARPGAR